MPPPTTTTSNGSSAIAWRASRRESTGCRLSARLPVRWSHRCRTARHRRRFGHGPPHPRSPRSPAMHAQLIEGGTTPQRREQMDRIVTDQLLPALHAEPGFAGALNLVDRGNGDAMMIVLWERE